jgi:hypothetical protein
LPFAGPYAIATGVKLRDLNSALEPYLADPIGDEGSTRSVDARALELVLDILPPELSAAIRLSDPWLSNTFERVVELVAVPFHYGRDGKLRKPPSFGYLDGVTYWALVRLDAPIRCHDDFDTADLGLEFDRARGCTGEIVAWFGYFRADAEWTLALTLSLDSAGVPIVGRRQFAEIRGELPAGLP